MAGRSHETWRSYTNFSIKFITPSSAAWCSFLSLNFPANTKSFPGKRPGHYLDYHLKFEPGMEILFPTPHGARFPVCLPRFEVASWSWDWISTSVYPVFDDLRSFTNLNILQKYKKRIYPTAKNMRIAPSIYNRFSHNKKLRKRF